MTTIDLTKRQRTIVDIVKRNDPITSTAIAEQLGVTRNAIRPDLSILTMSGILDAKPKVGYSLIKESVTSPIDNQLKQTKVVDICAVPVVVDETDSVYDAIVTMFLEDVGSIIVLSKGCLAGIVSRKDLIKASMGTVDIHKVPVGVIMSRMPNIYIAYPSERVIDVAKRLIEHNIDSIPVVKAETDTQNCYQVIGKISKTTITQFFVDLLAN